MLSLDIVALKLWLVKALKYTITMYNNGVEKVLKKQVVLKCSLLINLIKLRAHQNYSDTSVIIDGRIKELCNTGFIEGPLMVPLFVLNELQIISDSADATKRNRGRRGLDILKEMQDAKKVAIEVVEDDYDDLTEVDSKLMRLALDKQWKLMTNDFNLNKVARVQGIEVLNLNELANVLKPALIAGEWIRVQIMKEGKEVHQGVAYLDDGTMIVVEDGKPYVGQTVEVMVTSILQTSAGRMIFARVDGGQNGQGN